MIFAKIKGQAPAARVLAGMLQTGRIPPAMLFRGMEGTGKTLMAIEFAKTLLCRERGNFDNPACGACSDCLAADKGLHPDLTLVNARYQAALLDEDEAKQKTLRVDTIRRLRKDMEMRSLSGGWKIAIVENAHTLEIEAANALLKILEEPNPRSMWILASSERERLPRTVVSRCFSVLFKPLSVEIVRGILKKRGLSPARAERLAELSEGSASRAMALAASDYPQSLTAGPLAFLEAVTALPREGYLARAQVETALFALAQDLRLRHLSGERNFDQVERPLTEIARLRQALRSNADPKAVLILASLAVQSLP